MTKSKRFVSRMMFALLVLTLVSFCFVGFTFARYTSSGTQAATASVAKWSITGEFKGAADVGGTSKISMDKLSPSKDPYTGTVRTNDTKKEVLVITNASDVKATVTLEVKNIKVVYADGVTTLPDGLTDDKVKAHFTITLAKENGTAFSNEELTLAESTGTLTVWAHVVWTSDLTDLTGDAADAEDTLIGQSIKGIDFDITYTAVQASELPTA